MDGDWTLPHLTYSDGVGPRCVHGRYSSRTTRAGCGRGDEGDLSRLDWGCWCVVMCSVVLCWTSGCGSAVDGLLGLCSVVEFFV